MEEGILSIAGFTKRLEADVLANREGAEQRLTAYRAAIAPVRGDFVSETMIHLELVSRYLGIPWSPEEFLERDRREAGGV